ncbi:MAG: Rpn family recombination-promoting nuclease/putative transposase, partial [Bacteroidota bacterium]
MQQPKEELLQILHSPHDALFKKSMADAGVAIHLLKKHLPQHIKNLPDWDTMRHVNKSVVKEGLSHLHADMVWQCTVRNSDTHIYALVEHQSTPDRLLPFRVTQYDTALMGQHLEQRHKELPIIANVCLYAGKRTPYPYSIDLYDCFEDPVLARQCMGNPFTLILVDLNTFSEAELMQHGTADMLQILLKQGIQRSFLPWIKSNPDMIRRLSQRSYWVSGIHYMLGVEAKDDPAELKKAIIAIAPEKKEEIMTAAQKLWDGGKEEGRVEGREEGRVEGRVEG